MTALLGTYIVFYYQNNRALPLPDQGTISESLEHAIGWLVANRDTILDENNVFLWRMVERVAEKSGDRRVVSLFRTYEDRYLPAGQSNIWKPLFKPGTWSPVPDEYLQQQDYYQKFFLYAVSCDKSLGAMPDIAAQMDPNFCDRYLLRPACVTHQLMGFLLMQRARCADSALLQSGVAKLQRRIRRQLTWDSRVVDVYMQRVLMLVDSGGYELLKPVWIQRVLSAQQPDGGWAGVDPLLPIGGDLGLAFSQHGMAIARIHSNFHTTVQGALLMCLLDERMRQVSGDGQSGSDL